MDLYTGLPAACYAWETLFFFFFFHVLQSFWWGHMQCVCFGMSDWLNQLWVFIIYTVFLIKKKKCKKKCKEIILLTGCGDSCRLWSNEDMFQVFTLVWQTAQNGCLHKTGGTYYQSCMYPTNNAWPAFLMLFLIILPVSGHLFHSFTVPPTKVCLLCTTPAGTYWVQYPGFLKVIYL